MLCCRAGGRCPSTRSHRQPSGSSSSARSSRSATPSRRCAQLPAVSARRSSTRSVPRQSTNGSPHSCTGIAVTLGSDIKMTSLMEGSSLRCHARGMSAIGSAPLVAAPATPHARSPAPFRKFGYPGSPGLVEPWPIPADSRSARWPSGHANGWPRGAAELGGSLAAPCRRPLLAHAPKAVDRTAR